MGGTEQQRDEAGQGEPAVRRTVKFEQVMGYGLPIALLIACLLVVAPFIPALVWSAVIVVTLWQPLEWITARLGGRRTLVATLLALAMVALVVMPAISAVDAVTQGLPRLREMVRQLIDSVPAEPPGFLAGIPLVGERLVETWRHFSGDASAAGDLAARVAPAVGTWLLASIAGAGATVLQFLLVAIATAVLYAQGRAAADMAQRLAARLGGAEGTEALAVATRAIRGVSAGVIGTAAAQALLAGIGFAVAGAPAPVLLSVGVLVFGIIQLGPLPVWLPVVIWFYATGDTLTAVLLLVWNLGVVQTVDNFLRPILISRGARLPLLLMLIGVLGGLIAMGLIGIFLGPTLLGVGYVMLRRWLGLDAPLAPPVEDQREKTR
ncbi:AI-2E family transporter [Elioraea rosea]|uniref:AI-2E family transporter n=1 Tax=Elioraea rosea TaxID=2492390 RepID=UPI001315205A|nr:AI-2E family transporter [Elioraea rosea]